MGLLLVDGGAPNEGVKFEHLARGVGERPLATYNRETLRQQPLRAYCRREHWVEVGAAKLIGAFNSRF